MSAARIRAEKYAAMAPQGADVRITDVEGVSTDMTQVVIKGGIDTILITISSWPGKSRSRCSATMWFNSAPVSARAIAVGNLAYRIRNLFIA